MPTIAVTALKRPAAECTRPLHKPLRPSSTPLVWIIYENWSFRARAEWIRLLATNARQRPRGDLQALHRGSKDHGYVKARKEKVQTSLGEHSEPQHRRSKTGFAPCRDGVARSGLESDVACGSSVDPTRVGPTARKAYPLDWEEQQLLLSELAPHLQRMALFDVNTGLRDQEQCNLQWSREQRVIWEDRKGRRYRVGHFRNSAGSRPATGGRSIRRRARQGGSGGLQKCAGA